MTFTEAAAKAAALVERANLDEISEDEHDDLFRQWHRIHKKMFAMRPRTLADGIAILDRLLCEDTGLPAATGDRGVKVLARVRDLLVMLQSEVDVSSADSFGAAVEAFAAEAEQMVSLPRNLPEAAVIAAVEATGCTAEKVRHGFEAVVDAIRREAA